MAEAFIFHVLDDRTLEFRQTEPIMLEDNNVTEFIFRIPKNLNELDVSSWSWWFVYKNANGDKYSSPLLLTDDIDEPDLYSNATYWVDHGFTQKAGRVKVALEALNIGTGDAPTNEWHTKTYIIDVNDTLQGNQIEFKPSEVDIISGMLQSTLNQIREMIETGGVGGGTSDDIENKSTVSGATVTDALGSLSDQIANLESGAPTPAATVSVMVDTSKIYLYVGSETGYNAGHWYYWSGSAWTDGGVYNAAALDTDKTLSVPDKAADGKATGDALALKVDKVTGKGLSTNDYTTAEKTKLSGIAEGATKVEIDSTLSTAGKAADAKKTGDEISQLMSDLNGTEIPWELGGVTTAGLSWDGTRARTAITIKTVSPVTISTTSYIVSYVYDLSGNFLSGESNINWAKTTRTIKSGRLFRLATRKDDNTSISLEDMETLASGITFTFGTQGAELFRASSDSNGEHIPTISDAMKSLFDSASTDGDFALSLINLLKNVAFTSGSASVLLSSLAESLKKTVATIYNFEPRMTYYSNGTQGYIGSNSQRMTTQNRYFQVDSSYIYNLTVKANTTSKVWVGLQFLNANAVTAIKGGTSYSAADYYESWWKEVTAEGVSFDPSLITINSLPAVGVRMTFAFGDSHADTVSLIGTELETAMLERLVKINE